MDRLNAEQLRQIREIMTDIMQPLEARMEGGFAAISDQIDELCAEFGNVAH